MKFTVDGNVIEGTPEELAELMKLMGEGVSEVAEEVLAPKFKEGNRVKALTDGQFYDIEAGEIGEVTDIDVGLSDGDPYSIRVDIGDDYDYFRPQDLELVAEEVEEKTQYEQAIKFAKLGRKPGEYKKGDIVRVSWMDDKGFVNELAEIHSGPIGSGAGGNYYLNGGKDFTLGDDIELIAPVESRIDQ